MSASRHGRHGHRRRATPVRASTAVLGVEGSPTPVVARARGTRRLVGARILWVRSGEREESSTPRREQDDQETNAGGRNAAGNRESAVAPSSRSSRITGRIRILVIRPERALTWSGGTRKTTTPEPMDQLATAVIAAVSGPADDSFPVERIVGPCVIRPDGPARAGCGESRTPVPRRAERRKTLGLSHRTAMSARLSLREFVDRSGSLRPARIGLRDDSIFVNWEVSRRTVRQFRWICPPSSVDLDDVVRGSSFGHRTASLPGRGAGR